MVEAALPDALGSLPDWLRSQSYMTEYYGTLAECRAQLLFRAMRPTLPPRLAPSVPSAGERAPLLVELRNSTFKSGMGEVGVAPVVTLDRAAFGELVAGATSVEALASKGSDQGRWHRGARTHFRRAGSGGRPDRSGGALRPAAMSEVFDGE